MRRRGLRRSKGGEATTFTFQERVYTFGWLDTDTHTNTHAHTDFDDLHTDCSKAEHPLAAFLFTSIRGTSSTILSLSLSLSLSLV
jgi:hypothetical protein